MTPFLSIIIPAYNAGRFLSDCIRSILRQNFCDYEIIIVNDGSTDNTLKICKAFSDIDKRIKVIDQPNAGVSCARNSGLSLASGQYIWFIDADDEISNFSIAEIAESVRRLSYPDIIRGEYQAIDEAHKVLFKSKVGIRVKTGLEPISPEDFFVKCVRQDFFLWLLWIKRDIIADMLFPINRIYMEDADFICRLAPRIKTSAYSNCIIYNYRKYPGAASSELTINKVHDIHLFIACVCSVINQNESNWLTLYYKKVCNGSLFTILDFLYDYSAKVRGKLIEKLMTPSLLENLHQTFQGRNAEWVKIEKEGFNRYFNRYGYRKKIRTFNHKIKSAIHKLLA